MMTPQELKNSILQLAIQGKLVEQRPEEGTAAELYNSIAFKGKRIIHDEDQDDVPFDIPSSWMWVKHNTLFEIVGGSQPPKAKFIESPREGYVRLFQIRDYGEKPVPVYVPVETVSKFTHKGDILLARYGGSLGKIFWAEEGAYNVAMAKVVPLYTGNPIDDKYLFYYYCAPLYQTLVKGNTRSAQAGFNKEDLGNLLFPLPPLGEQKRIVARIEELLPLVERYEKAWSRLEDFNKRFPGDMQKSILQMAIQGKLVEQRLEEGTGEELYCQIQAEKQALIQSGKLKKQKLLPEITEDEIPFDIPESWKWVRIGKVFNLQAGKNITSADIFEEPSPEHRYRCYGGNGCRGYVADYNRSGHYALIGRQGALCGNINYADGLFYATEHAVVVEQFAETDVLWCGYFLKALNLNQYATATAQPGLAVANINQVLIPLPPLDEQKRIVAKLEELLPLCERLK